VCLAIPGEIIEIRNEGDIPTGKVRFGGALRDVCLSCVPTAVVGDYVLVHVGFAIARIDEEEAKRTLAILMELSAADEAFS